MLATLSYLPVGDDRTWKRLGHSGSLIFIGTAIALSFIATWLFYTTGIAWGSLWKSVVMHSLIFVGTFLFVMTTGLDLIGIIMKIFCKGEESKRAN